MATTPNFDNQQEAIKAGVADALDFWLSNHDVTFLGVLHEAAKDAFSEWLEAHTDDVARAIANRKECPNP